MGYLMEVDYDDKAVFRRIDHKSKKKINKQKYKRLLKIKKNSKRKNRR